jgi:hypothetical protein
MKKKPLLATLALATGLLGAAAPAAAGIVVTFTPSTQHANIGETLSVDVSIAGLGAEILSAFDLNFIYDGSVIGQTFRSIDATSAQQQLGGSYGFAPIWAIDSVALGDWGVQAIALADDATVAVEQADSFLLARFQFSADANGSSLFTLGPDLDFQRNFVGLNAQSLDVTVHGACLAVGTGSCAVPEPASYGLVGLALLGAAVPGALRRRRGLKRPA